MFQLIHRGYKTIRSLLPVPVPADATDAARRLQPAVPRGARTDLLGPHERPPTRVVRGVGLLHLQLGGPGLLRAAVSGGVPQRVVADGRGVLARFVLAQQMTDFMDQHRGVLFNGVRRQPVVTDPTERGLRKSRRPVPAGGEQQDESQHEAGARDGHAHDSR